MNTYLGQIGDKRLEARALLIEKGLEKSQTTTINKVFNSWSEQMSCYRFFSNEKVTESSLISSISNRLKDIVEGKQVLVFQDTSEYHYQNQKNKILKGTGLGETGRYQLGYFMHPSLVLDAEKGNILGLSSFHLWHRNPKRAYDSSKRKDYEIVDKESYKWILGIKNSNKVLSKAKKAVYIQDREGDIYETFSEITLGNITNGDLLVRSRTDRNIEGGKLYDLVASKKASVQYDFRVRDNKKRTSRLARMEVRFTTAKIKRPSNLSKYGDKYPEYIKVQVVEAKESAASVPDDETPIVWRILTTCEVSNWLDAVTVVYWYTLRWLIEELFGLHKSKGFNIEQSGLTTGYALRKLGIMSMQAALKTMQLKQARDEQNEAPIQAVFNDEEQECLADLLPQLEGNTEKLKNPHNKNLLIWGTWVIARLGGWKGYKSQRPPGLTTLSNGLERFENIYQGWSLANSNDI